MIALVRCGGPLRRVVLAAGLAAWIVSALPCKADGPAPADATMCPTCHKPHRGHHKHPGPGVGTLGYGPPGLFPGFQGFGLGYHPGYGYGGDALGVGADGGYPFYGGPGYPHPEPLLRRAGGITPFPFYGGPGGPTPECPNYFGPVGPLVVDPPIVELVREPGQADYAGDYGHFTGMLPYPEEAFAPFITSAAARGTSGGINSAPPPNAPPNTAPAPGEIPDDRSESHPLGLDAEPFTDAGGGRGLKVTRVGPGSPAQQAGLREDDVILSVNGYATEQSTNLSWIISNAAPDRVLKMSVRTARDWQVRAITTQLP